MSFEPNEEVRAELRRFVRKAMAARLRQKGGHIGYAGLLERDEEVSDWMTAFIEGAVDASIEITNSMASSTASKIVSSFIG